MAFVFKTELATPPITEVLGMGLDTNLVGILIFYVSRGQHLYDPVLIYGRKRTISGLG